MPVHLYNGLMGSGKSFSAVANVVIPCAREGRTIVTNVALHKHEILKDYPNANIITLPEIRLEDVERVFNINNFPRGAVFVIDEAGMLFPSGQKQHTVSQHIKEFFTLSRHSSGLDGKTSEIFLLCQKASQLAAWVRDLVDSQYIHTKLDKHGYQNMYRVDIYDQCHTGLNIPDQYMVSSFPGKYKSEFFKYYKSHTLNTNSFTSALEVKTDKRASYLGQYKRSFLYALGLLPLLFFIGYKVMASMLGTDDIESSKPVEEIKEGSSQPQKVDVEKILNDGIRQTEEQLDYQQSQIVIQQYFPHYKSDPLLHIQESDDFKLVGTFINEQKKRYVAMIRSTTGTAMLNLLESCSYRQQIGDWICIYKNKLVTSMTGPVFKDEYSDQEYDDKESDGLLSMLGDG